MNKGNPRDMSQYREQAKASRLAKQEAAKSLKQDWKDLPTWKELASKHGVRLPSYVHPNTETKYLRRLFKKVDMDIKDYLNACGVSGLKRLAALNPDYPARVEVGLALEWVDEQETGVNKC
jgi:hypothetical protein